MTDDDRRSDPVADRFRAIGARAAFVAHDLINVLAGIEAAAAEALAACGADGTAAGPLGEVQRYTERAAAMVRQMLGHGGEEPPRPRALGASVAEIVPLLRRVLGDGIAFSLLHDGPDPTVRIGAAELERVLTNLAANARDAMPGGGELVLRVGTVVVEQAAFAGEVPRNPGRYAVVEVADTGAGIPPDLLGQVSDVFVTTKAGGTGLGLATVRDIVDRAGGFVGIDSALGQGARFRIYLPCEPPHRERTSPTARVDAGAVLLVEDEDAIRRIAERGLRARGWQTLAAASAEEARALLGRDGSQRLALLISDFVLPGQDGLALLEALRGAHPGLPAILVSGYADEKLRRSCAEAEATLLVKPYLLRALLDTAAEVAGAPTPNQAGAERCAEVALNSSDAAARESVVRASGNR